jgi:hypothetical protein
MEAVKVEVAVAVEARGEAAKVVARGEAAKAVVMKKTVLE